MRTPAGAVLLSSAAASVLESAGGPGLTACFDPEHWRARHALQGTPGGRGSAWFVEAGEEHWVLRHYRRGGLPGRFLEDRYCWLGESRVRAFAEWRLTAHLHALGLPVPEPVAARYVRSGGTYRCDLITRRIPASLPLSGWLRERRLPAAQWRAVGGTIARFHANGLDHADLNAHNILIDARGEVSLVDFDRGRLRRTGVWRRRNLARLHRSLVKIGASLPADRVGAADWAELRAGYAEAGDAGPAAAAGR